MVRTSTNTVNDVIMREREREREKERESESFSLSFLPLENSGLVFFIVAAAAAVLTKLLTSVIHESHD